jgi:type IV pilus assembly protein PilB
MASKISEIIKKANIISPEELKKALEFSSRDNVSLPLFVLKNNYVDEDVLIKTIAQGLNLKEIVKPDEIEIDQNVLNAVSRDIAMQYRLIPLTRVANNLVIAFGDPSDLGLLDKISIQIGMRVRAKLASELRIEKALEKYYVHKVEASAKVKKTGALSEDAADSYVINYIEKLLQVAAQRKASDIHIEPFETLLRIRLRIDGDLSEYENRPRFEAKDALISRVKIVSSLDISEKRMPQDGNTKLPIPGHGTMDFRVSTLPTVWGEKIVLRLLDKENLQLDMTKLGFDQSQLDAFQHAIHQPFGMVIVTGPTGSGKTTSLYSALNELNRISVNIVTAEDPVEFTIPGICQSQMKPDIDYTFARALKSFLRQDPDVIMVGEIRDHETAEIAMKAALTGHIVLSTLHTNNAPETLERLSNMGVPSYTIISSINAVVAQRLVKKICSNCRVEDNISREEQMALGLPEKYVGKFKLYKGKGCELCNNTGYRGRLAIYEVLSMTPKVKEGIAKNLPTMHLKKIAMSEGMQTLRQSAWKKVFKGLTTISELIDTSSAD